MRLLSKALSASLMSMLPRLARGGLSALLGMILLLLAPALPAQPITLAEALRLLPQVNREIGLARSAIEVARADVRRADVGLNPVVTASTAGTRPGAMRPTDSDTIVRLEQTFERGGKRALRVAGSQWLERAARHDADDTLRLQRMALAQAYYDLVAAQQLLGFALENSDSYGRLVAAAERRLAAGDLAELDVARLRVEASRAANETRAARASVGQAQIALAVLLSRESTAAELSAADDFPRPSANPAVTESVVQAALERRPDVSAARARLQSLYKARELALSLRVRDVTLGVQTERSPSLGGNVFGISASIPLFLNNDFSGELARADADIELATQDLARLEAVVRAEVARASLALAGVEDRLDRLDSITVPQARRAAQAVEFAFERGAAPLTDLFDARRQLAGARAERTAVHAEYARTLTAWRESLALQESSP